MTKVVLATGVFDILHPGHIFYLTEAKKLGDELVVLVTSDKVASGQKRKPYLSQQDRYQIIQSLKMVDRVVIGSDILDYQATVNQINPDIIALGFDQKIDETDLRKKLGRAYRGKIIRLTRQHATSKSTTKIIENIISNVGGGISHEI